MRRLNVTVLIDTKAWIVSCDDPEYIAQGTGDDPNAIRRGIVAALHGLVGEVQDAGQS